MQTQTQNYARNIDILKENLERGMTATQANAIIENMYQQFVCNGAYGIDEKQYLDSMRALVIEKFTKLEVITN